LIEGLTSNATMSVDVFMSEETVEVCKK